MLFGLNLRIHFAFFILQLLILIFSSAVTLAMDVETFSSGQTKVFSVYERCPTDLLDRLSRFRTLIDN